MTADKPTPFELNRAQKAKLAAGECPGIVGKGECPVGKDTIIEVKAGLTLRVVAVDRPDPVTWRLRYEVRDRRDPVRLLRRTPPVVPPRKDEHPDAEAVKRAARESAYTSSHRSAVDDAGEAVDEKTQEGFTKDARERFRADLEAERERRKRLPLSEQLDQAEADAKARKVDVSGDLRVIEKRIDAMKRKADAA